MRFHAQMIKARTRTTPKKEVGYLSPPNSLHEEVGENHNIPSPQPSSTKPSNAANSRPSHLALNSGLPFPGSPGPTYRDLN